MKKLKLWLWRNLYLRILGFRLRDAGDASDQKLLADVGQYGWHVVQVPEDRQGPGFSFTVGLYYTYGHSELAIVGLHEKVAHDILWSAVGRIMTGKVYRAGDYSNDFIENYSCKLRAIDPKDYREYLGFGIWFYKTMRRPFPALQILYRDPHGKLPDEVDYDVRYRQTLM